MLGVAMARRRYQKGSLTRDRDRWTARWREDVIDQATGEVRRIQRNEILCSVADYPTKRLAQRVLDERLREVNREDHRPITASTFAEFADKWMKSVMIHHKPSTQASERSIIKVHLKPALGGLPLRNLTTEMLQQWISQHPASPKTVRNIVDCLRVMWTTAKAWDHVRHDPFENLVLPKRGKIKTYAFTMEETIAIIERAQEPWKTLIRIVAESGVRSGEVCGLRIEDLNSVNLTLNVQQSVWRREIQTPKSSNAIRREPISADLAAAVEHVIAITPAPNPHGLIFRTSEGRPVQMGHFINREFRPILEQLGIWDKVRALGIKQCGLHALRRMNGTQMDQQGVPLKTRQDRMGHAHASTTLTHYTKPIDEASRKFADRMGALLSPKGNAPTQ